MQMCQRLINSHWIFSACDIYDRIVANIFNMYYAYRVDANIHSIAAFFPFVHFIHSCSFLFVVSYGHIQHISKLQCRLPIDWGKAKKKCSLIRHNSQSHHVVMAFDWKKTLFFSAARIKWWMTYQPIFGILVNRHINRREWCVKADYVCCGESIAFPVGCCRFFN